MKRSRNYLRSRRREEPRQRTAGTKARNTGTGELTVSVNLLRIVACGTIFVSLVTLKLIVPGSLSSFRGTLGDWLVRDADFAAAFSSVGRAVTGEGGVLDSLEDAYVAVFGPQEAVEVSVPQIPEGEAAGEAGEANESPESGTPPRPYPEHASAEVRVLGFDCAAPLSGELTSAFGWRENPATGLDSFHYGVDLAAPEGTEIGCFADGTVGVVGDSVELGKYLTVHHEGGVVTLYAHCSRVSVSSGAAVRKGDKLGEVGSTGNATGPHLHFELHDGEDYLDPAPYLS